MSKKKAKGRIDIYKFFNWLKNKCRSNEYKTLNVTVIDLILSYISVNNYNDNEIIILVEEIREDRNIFEFVEAECRAKRVLIDVDYKKNTELNKFNSTRKINLHRLFCKGEANEK